jgi:hypothetical protein
VGSNPIGGAGSGKARYANWPSGQAQTLVSVGSNPTRAMKSKNSPCVGWALASPGGCNPPARSGSGGSTPSRRTRRGIHAERRPVRLSAGHLVLSQERRVRLPHGLLSVTIFPRRAGALLALMRPISRFESGAWDFAGGPALGRVSYARRMGSTPMPANPCLRDGRVGKLEKPPA